MSRLLGPLSETISRVSWRDWALAGDHTAGAETAPAAVSAVMDLRKSRRFIAVSRAVLKTLPQGACHMIGALMPQLKSLICLHSGSRRAVWCRSVERLAPVALNY